MSKNKTDEFLKACDEINKKTVAIIDEHLSDAFIYAYYKSKNDLNTLNGMFKETHEIVCPIIKNSWYDQPIGANINKSRCECGMSVTLKLNKEDDIWERHSTWCDVYKFKLDMKDDKSKNEEDTWWTY